jgi:hypothetical protein
MNKKMYNKIIDKYLDLVLEQCNKECDMKECKLEEQNDGDNIIIGKHNDIPDSKFSEKELSMGIEVEKEHTDDPNIAKSIARDHLSEFPDYYSRLKKMENEAKIYWKK